MIFLCVLGGIFAVMFAREAYLAWRLMREIERRDAVFNAQLKIFAVLAATIILDSLARRPVSRTVRQVPTNRKRLRTSQQKEN